MRITACNNFKVLAQDKTAWNGNQQHVYLDAEFYFISIWILDNILLTSTADNFRGGYQTKRIPINSNNDTNMK